MSIITISRGSASGGTMLAEALAERLGYDIVSREDIAHRAAAYGVDETELQKAAFKAPGFWDRFSLARRRYLAFFQAALCESVAADSIVFHGVAGHLLLPDISHVLSVRLIAPKAFRVDILHDREGMSREDAEEYIERVDSEREQWAQLLFGVQRLDPNLYDLVVNIRTLGIDAAVSTVMAAVGSGRFQPTPESRRALADLTLASRVRAALAADEHTAAAEVRVHAKGGRVTLRGRVRPVSLVEAILEIVGQVEGVVEIDRENLDAPELMV
ncbi:MAG: cytidylate kinase family protein [Acidobacteriota bacterium]